MEIKDAQLREAVASVLKSGDRRALAEVITEWLQPGHLTLELMSLLLDTKGLNPGDSLSFKVRKGLHVRTMVLGQMALKDELTVSERMAWVLDIAHIGVTANEMELQSGELGTVAEIKSEMQKKIVDYYLGKVVTMLSTVWTAATTTTNYTDCSGPINATALKAMIDTINQNTSGAKLIVGSKAALTPITTFGVSWSDGTALVPSQERVNEVLRGGWLGQYYGVPILAIDQVRDNFESYTKLIPEDKVLVIGDKVGKFITYGPVNPQEYTDPRVIPPQWNFDLWQQFGLVVLNATGIGVLAVS